MNALLADRHDKKQAKTEKQTKKKTYFNVGEKK